MNSAMPTHPSSCSAKETGPSQQSFSLIHQKHPTIWTGRTRSWVLDTVPNENDKPIKPPTSKKGTKRKALSSMYNMNLDNDPQPAAKRRGRPPKQKPVDDQFGESVLMNLQVPSLSACFG